MVDLFEAIDFKLEEVKPEFVGNEPILKILKELCYKKQRDLEILKNRPILDISSDTFALIAGLPITEAEKIPKLELLFKKKILPQCKLDKDVVAMKFETGPDGKTTGNAIFIMSDSEKALELVLHLDKSEIVPKQPLSAITFSKIDEILAYNGTEDLKILTSEEIVGWRKSCHTHVPFICFSPIRLSISSFDLLKKGIVNSKAVGFGGKINKSIFSSSGNYLLLLFANKLELRAGPGFETLNEFFHKGVSNALFSPQEQHIISVSATVNETKDSENAIVWCAASGQKLRAFRVVDSVVFYNLGFSFDDKYFAFLIQKGEQNLVGVYELPSMALLRDKDSLKRNLDAENVLALRWAKANPILAVLCGMGKSEVALFHIPSRTKIKWISFTYEIYSGSFQWSVQDKILLGNFEIKVKKKRETLAHAGKVDFAKQKAFVNVLPLDTHAKSIYLSPNGEYLVSIAPQTEKNLIQVMRLENLETRVDGRMLLELPAQAYNKAAFSPQSKFVVFQEPTKTQLFFCEFKAVRGVLAFKMLREVTISAYHECSWSPCGRFLALKKSLEASMELTLLDCFGIEVFNKSLKNMKSFSWRNWGLDIENFASKKELKELKQKIKSGYGDLAELDTSQVDSFKRQQSQSNSVKLAEVKQYVENFPKRLEEYPQYKSAYDKLVREGGETVPFARIDKQEMVDEVELKNIK